MSAPMTATPDSLPHCLRHGTRGDALAHAAALTSFLQITVEAFQHLDSTPPQEAFEGMDLCFCLLRDKIEIGGGAYLFPTYDFTEGIPQLCPREDL